MTNAVFGMHVSLIVRIAAQWAQEVAYGTWNPDFCSAEASGVDRFIEEMESRIARIKSLRDEFKNLKAEIPHHAEPASK